MSGALAEEPPVAHREQPVPPANGWSLYGVALCLRAENDPGAAAAEEAFRQAWKDADTEIGSTCLCVPPTRW